MRGAGRVVAVVQARMGSTRLPGKTLKTVNGEPLLGLMARRLAAVKAISKVVVATTAHAGDEPIVEFCAAAGLACWRGSEDDVLDRCYQAAVHNQGDPVMRFTGDCPLVSPALCQGMVERFLAGGFDYMHTGDSVPEGLGAEIFTFAAMDRAWREATLKTDREHMTMYIFRHGELFRKGTYELPEDDSAFRVVVDEANDFQVVEAIAAHFDPAIGTVEWPEIKRFLLEHEEIRRLNAGKARFEGYQKAWAAENPAAVNPRLNVK